MARARAYDEKVVLSAAMHAFRRHGYGRISVTELEAATGLGTSSLYHAFGDKAGLFRRALDHYVSSVVAPRLAAHAGPEATFDDLEQLFLTLFQAPFNDGYGCLVVNSATEFGSAETIASHGVRAGLGLVHRHIEDVVRRTLGPAAAEAEAARLALLYQGLLVLSRAGLLTSSHRDAIRHEFDTLRRHPTQTTTAKTHRRHPTPTRGAPDMTNTALNPTAVPSSPFYSQGIEVRAPGRLVFVSGQVGMMADGTVPEGIEAQAAQAVANLNAVLAEAGLTSTDLAKLTIYLTDPADVEPFVGAVAGTLPDPPPATTMLIVSSLASPTLRVEIEAVAAG